MSHHEPRIEDSLLTRRQALCRAGMGFGSLALGTLMAEQGLTRPALAGDAPASKGFTSSLAPKPSQFAPKAKRVIHLFMAGAPSHLELFDHRPQLAKFDGTLPPADLIKGYRAAFINPNSKLLGPKFKFAKYGQSGARKRFQFSKR